MRSSVFYYHVQNSLLTLVSIQSRRNMVHTDPSFICEIHFYINLSSTPRSIKWSLLIRCLHSNPVQISHTCAYSTQITVRDFFIQIFGKHLDHGDPDYEIFYFLCFLQLRPKFLSSAVPYPRKPSSYIVSLMWETKFHTHTKQQINSHFFIF